MTISHKLLVATLTLAIISPFTLDAMKRQRTEGNDAQEAQRADVQVEPTFGVGVGQACLHIANNINPENGFVCNEIGAYILSLNSRVSLLVDDITQNCGTSKTLLAAIERLCNACGPILSVEILRIAFATDGVSICDIRDNEGWTILHWAAKSGNTTVINAILNALTPKQVQDLAAIKDNNGRAVLHWAANENRAEVINTILNALTPEQILELISIKNNDYWTALHLAALNGHILVVNALLARLSPKQAWKLTSIKNSNGMTALHEAAYNSHIVVVNAILNALTEKKAQDLAAIKGKDGKTAYDWANTEIQEILAQYLPTENSTEGECVIQ